ncbi:hypothetical protein SCP_0412590 [Sparassis crispa]|uniref:Uncharacterized protein n=1 Tax=Sparassis crispa TaxID=139825 RepID=A0A401GL52_9APHY|nr:hypothetical protein SCP_0412590 [Sparassis crispa]GBE82872.1 hypothetical protein SCP_0412590 [Sparassis crispa]
MSHYSRSPSSSSSSSSSSATSKKLSYSELLAQAHANLASVPEELCPAATMSTPLSESRIYTLNQNIVDAVDAARANPAHPKWVRVSRLLKLQCTARGYVGVADGVRMGDTRKVEAGDYQWVLPDTEEEWVECEIRWANRFKARSSPKGKASKYWQQDSGGAVAKRAREDVPAITEVHSVHQKVASWRAEVVRESANAPHTPTSTSVKTKRKEKNITSAKTQQQLGFPTMKRSSILHDKSDHLPSTSSNPQITAVTSNELTAAANNPVAVDVQIPGVVRAAQPPPVQDQNAVQTQAPAKSQTPVDAQVLPAQIPVESQVPVEVHVPVEFQNSAGIQTSASTRTPAVPQTYVEVQASDLQTSSGLPHAQAEAEEAAIHAVDDEAAIPADAMSLTSDGPARIGELSEMSFLPPSFPSQLRTSTPQQLEKVKAPSKQRKPAPIPHEPHISLSSSPQSQPGRIAARGLPPDTSSSQPAYSPSRRAVKRPRHSTPTSKVGGVPTTLGLSYVTPPPKRVRGEPVPPSSEAPPPSTPPTATSELNPITPSRPVPSSKGLGNAKGLPVPTTPNRQGLPTLTELLASSRRSKPRPRPPSRKIRSETKPQLHNTKPMGVGVEDDVLPLYEEDEIEDPEPSPAKTYLSSPASGSSDSPGSTRHRPRSPISPLFTQQPDVFAPALASTQRLDVRAGLVGAGAGTHGSGRPLLAGGSSGFFGGYNSQFDVEGQIGRVSELLERDVDFEGWLRDVPDVEEEEKACPAQGMSQSQSQSQSQGQGELMV